MMNNTVNRLLYTLTPWLLAAMAMVACEEKPYLGYVDCSECYQQKPEECLLSIDLSLPESGRGVPLVIYRGLAEGGQVERIDTAYWTPYDHWAVVDQEYSVKAEYFVNNATVFVIDGTKPELRKVTDACDEECHVIVHTAMDARLNEKFP
jgi:hypothetical protein